MSNLNIILDTLEQLKKAFEVKEKNEKKRLEQEQKNAA